MGSTVAANADLAEALAAARNDYSKRNPKSQQLHEKACATLPGGNTRTILYSAPFPTTLVRGEGARLWDADGFEYIDFLGEYSAGLFGHSHPAIRSAVGRAMDGGIDLGGLTAMEAELAAGICDRFPSIDLVRFTNSGTEANLLSLAAARSITGRSRFLAFRGGYHGGVLMFVDGSSPINVPFDVLLGEYNDAEGAGNLIEANASDLAAVILEPMLGTLGCIPAERNFLEVIRQATRAHGIFLIFDEVMTSRLSPGGLQELHGILPDVTTLGKYLGGGMSFGAFGGRDDFMSRFDARNADAFPHAGTFNNNVLSMYGGVAALSIYSPGVARRHNARGDDFRERLNGILRRHDAEMQFTGMGSMIGIHMQSAPIRSHADATRPDPRRRELFFLDMLERGIWIGKVGMMTLSLEIGDAEEDRFVEALEDFLHVRRSLVCA